MIVRPCQPEDLIALDSLSSPEDRDIVLMVVESTPGIEAILCDCARTLENDLGHPMACFGFWMRHPGVATAWSDLSPEALSHPKTLHRVVSEEQEKAIHRLCIVRAEAYVKSDHEAGHRWVKHLGYEYEGLMRSFGVGGVGDYALYARVAS